MIGDCADISVKYPRLVGDGYLALSSSQGEVDQLTATIICRPETNNGLLLLNTDSIDAKHDFFSIAFVDGRAVFTYVPSLTVISEFQILYRIIVNATCEL